MYKIYQGSDGRWRCYVRDDTKPSGRRMMTASTKEKLLARLDVERKLHRGDHETMMSLYPEWLEYKKSHVASTTIDRIQADWRRYYSDAPIIAKPLSEITKMDLDVWIHDVIRSECLNRHQYNNFHVIVKQLLDYAVDVSIIDRSPLLDVNIKLSRVLTPEVKPADETQVFTKEEVQKFKEKAWSEFYGKKHPTHTLMPLAALFMFYTGLRIGELVALQWDDVNSSSITVKRFYRWSTKEIIEKTKGTFGARSIMLVPASVEILDACRTAQKNIKTDFVFSMNKDPLPYDDLRDKFRLYCKILGCENKSSHKARKTFISALIDEGMNINTVRQFAGHTDERTTFNNYVFDRSTDQEKMDKMKNALE